MPSCLVCRDARWVCEDHPDRAYGVPGGCECGGAGTPCPACNPSDREHPPAMPKGYRSFRGGNPIPELPRCRGMHVGESKYTGCAYGYGDVEPFTGACDCPSCHGSGIDPATQPN